MNIIKLTLLTLLFSLTSVYARDAKLELGIAVASLSYPDYLGSKSTQILSLPIPYLRYRSEYFRIDEDGLSSKLFGIKGLRLDISVNGSLPASSDNNDAREGMPDLDLTGEIGPKIIYNIYEHGVAQLEFELPIRAVLSTDLSTIKYRGITSTPQLKYSLKYSEIEFTLRSGLIFSNQDYNSYFYEVSDEYQTSTREIYKAEAGFGGFRNRVGVSYQKNEWWMGAFISHFNLSSAIYSESALIETETALYMGVSVAYIFYTEL